MERLTELFERLKKIDLLFLETKIKKFDLEEISPIFRTMYENYTKLENELDFFNPLSEQNKERIIELLSEFAQIAENINSFGVKQSATQEGKDALIRETTESYQNSYDFIRDFRIYFAEKGFKKFKRIKNQSQIN